MKDVFFLTNYFTYFNRISFQTHYGLFSNKIAKKKSHIAKKPLWKKETYHHLITFLVSPLILAKLSNEKYTNSFSSIFILHQ